MSNSTTATQNLAIRKGFSVDTKSAAVEEVEVVDQGQPEGAVISQAEAAEMENQINDMISEGNPNNQEMSTDAETETTTTETDTPDTSTDSGGSDSSGPD